MKGYGALIASARLHAGLTGEELAARMERTKTFVYRLEREETAPTLEQINQLVSLLPLSAAELLMACGIKLYLPDAAKLPTRLVSKLLALPPAQLAALTEFLPEPPAPGNRAGE